MNIALGKALTVSDYLAWAEAQGEQPRAELYNGQIVAMSPERAIHNRIKRAAWQALNNAVDAAGLPCEAFADGMIVPIDVHTAYGPDVVVTCDKAVPGDQSAIANPIIVVEVTSPSTAHTDTSAKLIGYFKLASLWHYLVIDPDARAVTHHARDAEGGLASRTVTTGDLQLDPPGISIKVDALFA